MHDGQNSFHFLIANQITYCSKEVTWLIHGQITTNYMPSRMAYCAMSTLYYSISFSRLHCAPEYPIKMHLAFYSSFRFQPTDAFRRYSPFIIINLLMLRTINIKCKNVRERNYKSGSIKPETHERTQELLYNVICAHIQSSLSTHIHIRKESNTKNGEKNDEKT